MKYYMIVKQGKGWELVHPRQVRKSDYNKPHFEMNADDWNEMYAAIGYASGAETYEQLEQAKNEYYAKSNNNWYE